MKRLFSVLIGTILLASPAHATTGLICTTGEPRLLRMTMVIGHTAVPAIVSAQMTDKARDVPVIVAQSWFDSQEVRIDLVDRNALRHEARLRATWRWATRSYDGSIWRGGQRRWIRCREG